MSGSDLFGISSAMPKTNVQQQKLREIEGDDLFYVKNEQKVHD